jgi:hypothetical protein
LVAGKISVRCVRHRSANIALLSYAGGLYWGFNADWDAIADLHDLVDCFSAEFAELKRAAGVRGLVTRDHGAVGGAEHRRRRPQAVVQNVRTSPAPSQA